MKLDDRRLSIIVQGPVQFKGGQNITRTVLSDYKRVFPNSQLIFSTWEGENVADLVFDNVIFNVDPGHPDYGNRKSRYSVNRQIVATNAALGIISRDFCLKSRSDVSMLSPEFFRYFNSFPSRHSNFRFTSERIIVANVTSVNPRKREKALHHPSDWIYFGLSKDIRDLWDIPLCNDEDATWFLGRQKRIPDLYVDSFARFQAEQYIWASFLKKHTNLNFRDAYDYSQEELIRSEEIFANNLIVLEPHQLSLKSYKYDLSSNWFFGQMYTHQQWKQLYNKYAEMSTSGSVSIDTTLVLHRLCYIMFRCRNLLLRIKRYVFER